MGPSESKMWRMAENKPSGGPPECGRGLAQCASNRSGPDADHRETVSDSGGPRLGPFGSVPRDALALAPRYKSRAEQNWQYPHFLLERSVAGREVRPLRTTACHGDSFSTLRERTRPGWPHGAVARCFPARGAGSTSFREVSEATGRHDDRDAAGFA